MRYPGFPYYGPYSHYKLSDLIHPSCEYERLMKIPRDLWYLSLTVVPAVLLFEIDVIMLYASQSVYMSLPH